MAWKGFEIYIDEKQGRILFRSNAIFGSFNEEKERRDLHWGTTGSEDCLFTPKTRADQDGLIAILKERGIQFSYGIPPIKGIHLPPEVSYSGGAFNNRVADTGFITGYGSVDEVIAMDQAFLDEVGGSFKDIADRMAQILEFAENIKISTKNRELVDREYERISDLMVKVYGIDWECDDNPALKRVHEGLKDKAYIKLIPEAKLDNKVVAHRGYPKGDQNCPFEGCNVIWNDETRIINPLTYRPLHINEGTEHLVRVHSLLQKGEHEFAITAKEFYEHYMP